MFCTLSDLVFLSGGDVNLSISPSESTRSTIRIRGTLTKDLLTDESKKSGFRSHRRRIAQAVVLPSAPMKRYVAYIR